tara:strand:+ start:1545 stop:1670 length:126 start_codon:yes stop_codon:yes gene_type:complete
MDSLNSWNPENTTENIEEALDTKINEMITKINEIITWINNQ